MRQSAGLLVYRFQNSKLQFFLVHPGGPFWKNKDEGAWSVPKGEFATDEVPLDAAKREFKEETGFDIEGDFKALYPVKQKSGKIVHAWAVEGNVDADNIQSNTFPLQWPPASGQWIQVPEVDKGAWFSTQEAMKKINPAQADLITQVCTLLNYILMPE